MPILTINLLNDDGRQNLNVKMEEMADMLKEDPTNTMEWKEEGGVN